MNENQVILVCEDSAVGIFSAIYLAYEEKLKPENTIIEISPIENYRLFTQYKEVKAEEAKAQKVERTIRQRFGAGVAHSIWCGIYSTEREKADIIYHVIARGLANKSGDNLIHELQNPYVLRLSKLQKKVSNEAHHFKGFLRFSQWQGDILFGKICPKNQILPLIRDHFEDRFFRERFLIYDERHKVCLIHQSNQQSFFYYPTEEEQKQMETEEERVLAQEDRIRELFRCFHEKISIEERKNIQLQKNLLPLRFRGNMIEF